MMRYTIQQRVEIHYQSSESVASTLRQLSAIYGIQNHPDKSTINRVVKKFEFRCVVQNAQILRFGTVYGPSA